MSKWCKAMARRHSGKHQKTMAENFWFGAHRASRTAAMSALALLTGP